MPVEAGGDGVEPLLASCVPDLELHHLSLSILHPQIFTDKEILDFQLKINSTSTLTKNVEKKAFAVIITHQSINIITWPAISTV